MKKKIKQVGDPILTLVAKHVDDVTQVHALINEMRHAMTMAEGVGIAAPQLGVSLRIMIVGSAPNSRYPDAPLMAPITMINPIILHTGLDKANDWEGCLSVAGRRGLVPRFTHIDVEYLDENSQIQRAKFDGFIARIFQHELDHLNGMTFLDRAIEVVDIS
ncbi:peptide deformylase [Thaumasiovibrio sp. DFM-14]|uniref:peptide deformylase n=1 Tax=Thaumasiovibrio sp. DFM-14 TaxID=3384792 RepID=UPI0039A2A9D5